MGLPLDIQRILLNMIALISDIHGNFSALKSVLDEIDSMGINRIYCLGDTAGYYAEINECCEELQKRNIPSVMGNHDWYMASHTKCSRSKSVNDCLNYQRKVISPQNLKWIQSLPCYMSIGDLSIVHGGWSNPIDEYVSPDVAYFHDLYGHFFSSGHTHRQTLLKIKGKTYCNPGSVGQPRDHKPSAAFATFDGLQFFLHRVEYDFEKTGKLMEEAGFSGYYYGCLRDGSSHLKW